jgi:hypothetical protein
MPGGIDRKHPFWTAGFRILTPTRNSLMHRPAACLVFAQGHGTNLHLGVKGAPAGTRQRRGAGFFDLFPLGS